ncbi:hypothetical protein VII00023_08324 [Vibrio ichthyoenteri ATCC 700023]|uniref:Uncharacterized protein n=1 Tax=Vibrio ichthyoenteri ATCC 700023 TaxID=870968 RepID=F9S4B6_9VIBR|nr:hypothetical protein [Vibrio ichthyoenteri]EGU36924.1 hypothetical protein VII00023_08324 [Vibrio ichthyoenteri ATCC 700023]
MKALDKLRALLMGRLRMTTIMEPSNATARRHVRVMASNIKLTPLPIENTNMAYMPYECLMDIVISYRISGGNMREALTHTSLAESLLITEMLSGKALDIKDVAEALNERDEIRLAHPDWSLSVVGDALLYGATRVGDGFANQSQFSDHDEISDDIMAYEDQWKARLSLTLHRHFPNPTLRTITMVNDHNNEENTVE